MPPLLRFILRRLFFALASFLVITMVLYAGMTISPPEARARLYLPPGKGGERATQNLINVLIRQNHLDRPFLIQYGYWMKSLFNGEWGYSPTSREYVLPALMRRTPATLELAFFSLILLIPLGLASGLKSGWNAGGWFDFSFRSLAFIGTSMPPFILSMVLLALFYVRLGFAGPGRLDFTIALELSDQNFRHITGFYTIDSLLNQRLDVFVDSLTHLFMPGLTLSWFHWATLGRITRATLLKERSKEYLVAAKARGVRETRLVWRHALRAILAPSLTGIALSAAGILSGVFVVETIFSIHGVSEVILNSMSSVPDAPAALGFSVYSILLVIFLMIVLDILQALLDPRIRDEVYRT
jgi:peptide/nickel transport system permease protein